VLAQDNHVQQVLCVLTVAVFLRTYVGVTLEIYVVQLTAVCVLKAAEVVLAFVQQEHLLTAVIYTAHSAQHSYQITTALSYVINVQVDLLVAVMAAISTVAVVLVMWHLKAVAQLAHVKQKFMLQLLLEFLQKKVPLWHLPLTMIMNSISGAEEVINKQVMH